MIYQRELGGTAADIRESDFARALWPFDPSNRELAWRICVEGLAAGANLKRVEALALLWQCDDVDADVYARCVSCNLSRDGNQWFATAGDFKNLAESPAGFGDTKLAAMADLARALDYKPRKMWGAGFSDLLKQHLQVAQNSEVTEVK